MYWYTKNDGQLCLGTENTRMAEFEVSTEIFLQQSLSQPLMEEHIQSIGSYPEDWNHDARISEKINAAAKFIFSDELAHSEPQNQSL